jgi:hypothetical protein
MYTRVTTLVLISALSGCGFIKVNGGPAEPEPTATPASSEQASDASGAGDTTAAPANARKQSKGDLQCQSTLMGALQHKAAIERNGEVFISTANEGFLADDLKRAVTSCYEQYGETPSAEKLAEADTMMKEQREAAIAAAPKWKLPEPAAADPAAEAAIKKDFLVQHPGSDIKRVTMTSGWKQNMNGLVVRNRYKEAIVLIGVKGTDICLRVQANAAQDANGSGGFDSKYKHDVFDAGTAVPCK